MGVISSKNLAQTWIRKWPSDEERNYAVLECPTVGFPWRDSVVEVLLEKQHQPWTEMPLQR